MNPLVTPSWLSTRLQNPDTIILDATLPPVGVTPAIDTHARYLAQHIPGAIFFDIEDLSNHTTPLPHMLPTAEDFSRSMSALGISDNATIVVYEQESVFSAPRAWWTLRTFGAQHVYLLDGGLRAWVAAGFQIEAALSTESGPVRRTPATFHAKLNPKAVKDLTQLKAELENHQQIPQQILDARSAARFNGTAPEPRPGLPSGHMPGATSVPFTELVEDGRLKPADKLQQIFATKKIDLQQPITTTCGSGVTAAVIALSLAIVGAPHVSLYDGSWAEYAQQPDTIIEKNS
jgi:thiosulfate/3-mercaptopyruvate sulfurtransferase